MCPMDGLIALQRQRAGVSSHSTPSFPSRSRHAVGDEESKLKQYWNNVSPQKCW
jgi:hypothetical protein